MAAMKTPWDSHHLSHGIHAFVGGSGTPVILLPGWPETAEAYADIFPLISSHHRTFAIDPPGLGSSAPSSAGYDTATISGILNEVLDPIVNEPYHLVGHDVGAWIAYAWAAQFPSKILSLTLLDSAIPGLAPPQTFPLPYAANLKQWQFSFNALPDLPEILTNGRERELLDWLFNNKAEHPERITRGRRDRYVECYARPGGMSQGFAYYRAVAGSAEQNVRFGRAKLRMPVLALGGKSAVGKMLRDRMESLATNVQGGDIDDCGHYVMEEQPDQVASRLLEFFQSIEPDRQSGKLSEPEQLLAEGER